MSVAPLYGGISEWQALVLGRAQNEISQDLRNIVSSDLFSENDVEPFSAVDGTVTFDVPMSNGWANLQAGPTLGGGGGVINAGGAILVGSANSEPWYAHTRCIQKLDADSDATYTFVGLKTRDSTEFVNFGILGGSGVFDRLSILLVLGTAEYITSDVLIDTTIPHHYALGFKFDELVLIGYVDGIEVLRTTSLSRLTSQPVHFYSFVSNGGVSANRQHYIDHIATVVRG